jgi:50S ribosomal subunit-associated GTPase HflX
MGQNGYALRGDGTNEEIARRLRDEIAKLENQLERLHVEDAPHRFSLMKTYRTMIASRQELLSQIQ